MLPYVWLLLFFLAPFLIILKISFAEPIIAQPPFTVAPANGASRASKGIQATFENYAFLFQDGYYGIIYLAVAEDGRDRHVAVPAARLSDGAISSRGSRRRGGRSCCSRSSCRSGSRSCCASTRGSACSAIAA